MGRRRIVVVGGGTAGSVATMRLASSCDDEITVVEPGPRSSHDMNPRFFDALADGGLHRIESVSLTAVSQPVPYLQAAAIGGGSAVNGMLLSGAVPPVAEGFVTTVPRSQMGLVGGALVDSGGEPARLWWNAARWNPGRALLHACEEGRVSLRQAAVERLEFAGDTVRAVHTDTGVLEADLVVMCAGAIATPRILLRSGVDRWNNRVGLGLQDHPSVTFAVPLGADNPSGFDATAVLHGGTPGGGRHLIVAYERASAHEAELGLVSVILLNPGSRGAVRLRGSDCTIEANMLATGADVAAMRSSVRALLATVRTTAFSRAFPAIFVDPDGTTPGELAMVADDAMDAWIVHNVRPVFHAAASCSMALGRDGALAGTNGVHVADASALPRVPQGTPAADVTMVAEHVARAVAQGG